MYKSTLLQSRIKSAIASEIAQRVENHQGRVANVQVGLAASTAAGAALAPKPLAILSVGDSWGDYPLNGNEPSFVHTDVFAQLAKMGNIKPLICNILHHGNTTLDEMCLSKQQLMIQTLQNPDNWLTGKPDAILFSGGGNDVAGEQFCIYLDSPSAGSNGLDQKRFQLALDSVEASYLDLFSFRDTYAPGVPIFGHCYDFPIPNGTHPLCTGPWLQPSLQFSGWFDLPTQKAIARNVMTQLHDMLSNLANVPQNNFVLVETQGTLSDEDWANELHPYPLGFQKIASKFLAALQTRFLGRI